MIRVRNIKVNIENDNNSILTGERISDYICHINSNSEFTGESYQSWWCNA